MSESLVDKIDLTKIPNHIAIMMDGNRRWAKKKGFSKEKGHWEGAKVLSKVVKAAGNLGVKVVTVYAFSTENWLRSKKEITSLMYLFETYLINKRNYFVKNGVKLETIGDITPCPDRVKKALEKTKKVTENCNKMTLVVAFNYGGRDEIKRAVKKMLVDYDQGKIKIDEVTENTISQYVDTAKWKDPELLIRTSGEYRLSNFLLWQSSYTEIVIVDTLWPDFTKENLYLSILEYQLRQRRLGE